MPDVLRELARLGHVARVATLLARGVSRAGLRTGLAAGLVLRPRHGWIVSPLADRDQLRAIAAGGRIGCVSALRRFGVWSGVDDTLHLQVHRTASRVHPSARSPAAESIGVWHPSVPSSRSRTRTVRLASDAAPRVHWAVERMPRAALDWITSPQSALACALRCLDAEHGSAAIDSALHEGVLTRRQVDEIVSSLPDRTTALVDEFTGRPESGVESLFVRRVTKAGFQVEPEVDLAGFGRYDGVINGCVLFEVDGRGFHSGAGEFFADRDRTLVGLAFGVPVIRPSARHVTEEWPLTLAAVTRTVADAEIVRRHRGLPPIAG